MRRLPKDASMPIETDTGRPNSTGEFDWTAFDALTDEDVEAAAKADPDNPPLTEEQLSRLRPVALCKQIRWKLRLSREDFASRYRISLEVITAWERHRTEPDAIALTYLDVVAADPDGVAVLLGTKPTIRHSPQSVAAASGEQQATGMEPRRPKSVLARIMHQTHAQAA